MNFTEWCRSTRRTRKKIHHMGLKIITGLNVISLLFLVVSVDGFVSWQPYMIMLINIGWLFLMGYANGWIMDTKPYYERLEKERVEEEW